ncbi:hypothetical protein BACCIP111895_03060 [Neobacillus rhizosphaerae]|uniref:DUF7000 domain-containing protein n=1 Tax=Neobacillus rhizosphaerae TaxID=2880965 RepID=A0ABN8KQB7_9BACI|nr:hypothetical protein BACCIP111895_03060 [Neobacillus rhizosphaerae]
MTMPRYSVLETILVDNPDFDSLEKLTEQIEQKAFLEMEIIIEYLKRL